MSEAGAKLCEVADFSHISMILRLSRSQGRRQASEEVVVSFRDTCFQDDRYLVGLLAQCCVLSDKSPSYLLR